MKFQYVKTDLGQLHIATAGQGDPIILLHQTLRSWDEFRELIPLLAVEHRVIAMDMYGFGQSAKFPAPQTIEKYASGVIALADAIGLPSADNRLADEEDREGFSVARCQACKSDRCPSVMHGRAKSKPSYPL